MIGQIKGNKRVNTWACCAAGERPSVIWSTSVIGGRGEAAAALARQKSNINCGCESELSVVGVRLNTDAGTSLVIATASATEPSSSPLTQFTTSHARAAPARPHAKKILQWRAGLHSSRRPCWWQRGEMYEVIQRFDRRFFSSAREIPPACTHNNISHGGAQPRKPAAAERIISALCYQCRARVCGGGESAPPPPPALDLLAAINYEDALGGARRKPARKIGP